MSKRALLHFVCIQAAYPYAVDNKLGITYIRVRIRLSVAFFVDIYYMIQYTMCNQEKEEKQEKPSILQRMSNFMSTSSESTSEAKEESSKPEVEEKKKLESAAEQYYEVAGNGDVMMPSASSKLDIAELVNSIEEIQKVSHTTLLSKQNEAIESLRQEMYVLTDTLHLISRIVT